MKAFKTLLITLLLITGATAFSSASEKKNKIIIKEINSTNYSKLMGVK